MEQLNAKLLEYKWPIALSLVGLVLIIGGLFSSNLSIKPKTPPKESLIQATQIAGIKVDVSGAVKNPGVISLGSGSRVQEALIAAGGVTENANSEYLSKTLNLSQKLSDGQKIYIPFQGEGYTPTMVLGTQAGGKVNLNTASLSDLDRLPGIGLTTAQKIIDARPYQKSSELLDKRIVSKTVFEKIQDQIEVN